MLTNQGQDWLLKRLEGEEGFRQYPYDDITGKPVTAPIGKLTVGYGLNLQDRGIKQHEAEFIACNVINECFTELTNDLSWFKSLDEARQCVLIDMAYNMGIHGVEAFYDTLNLVASGFYANAAAQMRKSVWYDKLTSRAEPLCKMMETGKFL